MCLCTKHFEISLAVLTNIVEFEINLKLYMEATKYLVQALTKLDIQWYYIFNAYVFKMTVHLVYSFFY